MPDKTVTVTATVLDEDTVLSVTQLCESLGLELDDLVAYVQEGLVEPRGGSPQAWSFPGPALKRLRTALRLRRELEIDLAGTILAVELLEEIERLRTRLRALELLDGKRC
ncbi:MAG: chaperone modulator CbpM [Acidiferrobacterales bacterium]